MGCEEAVCHPDHLSRGDGSRRSTTCGPGRGLSSSPARWFGRRLRSAPEAVRPPRVSVLHVPAPGRPRSPPVLLPSPLRSRRRLPVTDRGVRVASRRLRPASARRGSASTPHAHRGPVSNRTLRASWRRSHDSVHVGLDSQPAAATARPTRGSARATAGKSAGPAGHCAISGAGAAGAKRALPLGRRPRRRVLDRPTGQGPGALPIQRPIAEAARLVRRFPLFVERGRLIKPTP